MQRRVDAVLAGSEEDGAAVALGVGRPRGGAVEGRLDARGVAAAARPERLDDGQVRERDAAAAVAGVREVGDAVALGVLGVDEPAVGAAVDDGRLPLRRRGRRDERERRDGEGHPDRLHDTTRLVGGVAAEPGAAGEGSGGAAHGGFGGGRATARRA